MVDDDGVRSLPIRVSIEDCILEGGILKAFHVRPISRGVWVLAPSLNVPGAMHVFLVLTNVPAPAPWQRLILMPGEF